MFGNLAAGGTSQGFRSCGPYSPVSPEVRASKSVRFLSCISLPEFLQPCWNFQGDSNALSNVLFKHRMNKLGIFKVASAEAPKSVSRRLFAACTGNCVCDSATGSVARAGC